MGKAPPPPPKLPTHWVFWSPSLIINIEIERWDKNLATESITSQIFDKGIASSCEKDDQLLLLLLFWLFVCSHHILSFFHDRFHQQPKS